MWFKVRLYYKDAPTWYGDGLDCKDQAEAEDYVRRNLTLFGEVKCVLAVPDPEYPKRKAERQRWAEIWRRAHDNMPMLPNGSGKALVICSLLGYLKKKRNSGMFVAAMKRRGSKPRDPQKAEWLERLAGPYGTAIALMSLKRRGITRFTRLPE